MIKKIVLLALLLTTFSSVDAQIFNKAARELKNAKEQIDKKNYEDALKTLSIALDLSKGKDDYEIFYQMGFCYYNLNKDDKALEQLSHAVSKVNAKEVLPPKTSIYVQSALLYRAKTLERQKNYLAAIKDLQLLASVPDNTSYKSLGFLKWAENMYAIDPVKNLEAAKILAQKAVNVENINMSAYMFIGELYLATKDYKNAVNNFSIAVGLIEKAAPIDGDVTDKGIFISLLALSKFKIGLIDESKILFQKAIDVTPESYKWKTYQYQAELIIKNKAFEDDLINIAERNAAKAAILSESCETNFTLAYTKLLTGKLVEASKIATPLNCNSTFQGMTASSLKSLIADLTSAQSIEKLKIYDDQQNWYYWGTSTAGLANGKGRALHKSHLYEVENGTFVKGSLVSGTLKNLKDGWVYTGAFSNGTLSGIGKKTTDGGDIFSGKFVANKLTGQGKCIYVDGSSYEGSLLADKPNGIGILLTKSGDSFKGSFKNGLPNGLGVLTTNGLKENVKFTNGERSDEIYLAKMESSKKAKLESTALLEKQLAQQKLEKAEKKNNFSKLFGKTLVLAGGALALKEASDLGMSTNDVTELGVALASDILSDNKDNNFINTLAAKNSSGSLGNNSILSNVANANQASNLFAPDVSSISTGTSNFNPGIYASGNIKVNISRKDNGLYVTYIIPKASDNYYTSAGGNLYTTTSKYGTVYLLQVLSNSQIKTFQKGNESSGEILQLTENASPIGENDNFLKIAEKYKAMMKTDPNDAQAWAFCAMAAHAKTTHTADAYTKQVTAIAASLKQIVPSGKCPCEDAIPPAIWKSIK